MLIYFTVGNYKSIKDPVTINFNATAISEHRDSNVVKTGGFSLLKSIVLYGHNAGGKSKILDAFVFFKGFILQSATLSQGNEPIDVEAFDLNDNYATGPSFFEACFLLNGIRYRYGFEADRKSVVKEWLLESKFTKEIPLFIRMGDEYEIRYDKFENAEGVDKKTRKNTLFLSAASQWNVQKAGQINTWFGSIFSVLGSADHQYQRFTMELLKNKKQAAKVIDFIRHADLGIDSLELAYIPLYRLPLPGLPEDLKSRKIAEEYPVIYTYHQKYNDEGEPAGKAQFLMDQHESDGTRKYFNLAGLLLTALEENRPVIIDELDAGLHTLMARAIVKLFNSSTTGSTAQLLVASHDTNLLNGDLLRRDQIYFVEKNAVGASELTSLVEYKVRKESPFDKNYLKGEYGAIPFINSLESTPPSHGKI